MNSISQQSINMLEKSLSELTLSQMVRIMNFLSKKITEKTEKMSVHFEEDEKNDNSEIAENRGITIPNPKPIWWDYPISDFVKSLAPKERTFVADDYKEDLYNALREKYEGIH